MLSIELAFLCGPAIALLSLGVLYLPALLMGFTSGSGDWHIGGLMTICGLWGSTSLVNLVRHTFSKEHNWPGRPTQWLGLTGGRSRLHHRPNNYF